jgi:hypothetical protein
MATYKGITTTGFFLRLLAAAILVFATYNPSGKSYYHWLSENISSPTPLLALAGVLLLIGWTIYLRATSRSLGAFGLFLAAAFFGVLVWMVIDWGWVDADSIDKLTWIFQVILVGVLAIGITWSHIRRRMTGQVDVDEIEGDI